MIELLRPYLKAIQVTPRRYTIIKFTGAKCDNKIQSKRLQSATTPKVHPRFFQENGGKTGGLNFTGCPCVSPLNKYKSISLHLRANLSNIEPKNNSRSFGFPGLPMIIFVTFLERAYEIKVCAISWPLSVTT